MVLPTLSPKKAFEDLKAQLVDLANTNENRMDGTMTLVHQIIAENEVVFAVCQDAREPDGVGMLLIKGGNRIRDKIAADKGAAVRMSAIKTIDADQAEELRRSMGYDRTHCYAIFLALPRQKAGLSPLCCMDRRCRRTEPLWL